METASAANPLLPPSAGPTLEAVIALDGAIAAARKAFGPLRREAENTYLQTTYLPLDALLDAIRDPLLAAGVLITSSIQLVPGGFVVTTSLCHSGGGWRSSSFPVSDPTNPQKVAAAGTYGLRVNLCQLLTIVPRDDDGESNAHPPTLPGEPAQWRPAATPAAAWTPPAAPASAPTPYL
jgi:hypothetical protein